MVLSITANEGFSASDVNIRTKILTSEYPKRTDEDDRRRSHIGRTESEINQIASALNVWLEGRDGYVEVDLPSVVHDVREFSGELQRSG